MLRRRIFSAAMASVMALSTVAVVAQAEETKAVKSYEDLDKLVNETYGTDYRTGELLDHGTTQTERMLDALDAAEAVLYDAESKSADFTVAWYMVEGVKQSLYKYTYDDLQKLIKKAEPYFAKNNIRNPELNDNIYPIDLYSTLEEEYNDALTFTETDAVPDITEAYEQLEAALKAMYELPTVTKSQYRAVLNEYEAIIADAHKYDSWRRGTMDGLSNGWAYKGGVAFGYVYDTVLAAREDINEDYAALDAIKGLSLTSDVDIRAGYELAQNTVKFYKQWAADTDTRGSSAAVKNLLNKYNGQLVYDFMPSVLGDETATFAADTTLCDAIGKAIQAADSTITAPITYLNEGKLWLTEDAAEPWGNGTLPLLSAEANVKLAKTVYIPVDQNNKWIAGEAVQTTKPINDKTIGWTIDKTNAIAFAGTEVPVRYLALSAGSKFDLADYIKLDVDVIVTAAATEAVAGSSATGEGSVDGNGGFVVDNGSIDFSAGTDFGGAGWNISDMQKNIITEYAGDAAATEVDLAVALVMADAYMNGAYANIDDSDGDAKKVAQAAKFDVYNTALASVVANVKNNPEAYTANMTDINDIIDAIDEAGVVGQADADGDNGRAKGQVPEWTTLYRYLKYALEDAYAGKEQTESTFKKWADVNALVADATELIEKTGEAAIFAPSNVALVEARQVAREWLARSKSDQLYKENAMGLGADGVEYMTSDNAYKALSDVYTQLADEFAALNIGLDEVYEKIADTAKAIDEGDLNDSADLQDAIKVVARRLSEINDITFYCADADDAYDDEYVDNAAFDESREFLPVNRVVTGKADIAAMEGGVVSLDANPTHKALGEALTALDAAIEKATEPEVVVVAGDYDVDGDCDLDDASAMIADEFAGGMDQTKGDFNGDGATDLDDVSAIIAKEFEL